MYKMQVMFVLGNIIKNVDFEFDENDSGTFIEDVIDTQYNDWVELNGGSYWKVIKEPRKNNNNN